MNNATIFAMREIAKNPIVPMEGMTAKEMALTSHNLDRSAEVATLPDGRKFVWFISCNEWRRFK